MAEPGIQCRAAVALAPAVTVVGRNRVNPGAGRRVEVLADRLGDDFDDLGVRRAKLVVRLGAGHTFAVQERVILGVRGEILFRRQEQGKTVQGRGHRRQVVAVAVDRGKLLREESIQPVPHRPEQRLRRPNVEEPAAKAGRFPAIGPRIGDAAVGGNDLARSARHQPPHAQVLQQCIGRIEHARLATTDQPHLVGPGNDAEGILLRQHLGGDFQNDPGFAALRLADGKPRARDFLHIRDNLVGGSPQGCRRLRRQHNRGHGPAFVHEWHRVIGGRRRGGHRHQHHGDETGDPTHRTLPGGTRKAGRFACREALPKRGL